jgi:hypothetical protein
MYPNPTLASDLINATDHEFYRDVLHPSIHGDALHLAMRVRDQASKRTWVHKCLFHANYVHMLLQFAKRQGSYPPKPEICNCSTRP